MEQAQCVRTWLLFRKIAVQLAHGAMPKASSDLSPSRQQCRRYRIWVPTHQISINNGISSLHSSKQSSRTGSRSFASSPGPSFKNTIITPPGSGLDVFAFPYPKLLACGTAVGIAVLRAENGVATVVHRVESCVC